MLDEEVAARKAAEADAAALRKALDAIMNLLADGTLVRDISHDLEPGWPMRTMELFVVLKQAQDALTSTTPEAAAEKRAALGERAIAEIRLVRCGHEGVCAHFADEGCDCTRSRLRAILAEWDALAESKV